ncbi:hypothetical protein MNBD_GAMMA09-3907 [hydrothermal vent metagenome]|uniref:FOG: HEAT repeat n=1 Tax=hydrothermal vent metagenome TaxID=652676 RepID=A0A3B0XR64_9ZZZZ
MTLNTMNAYKDIYEQYVTEASFLWILRSIAVEQPHYTREDIYELEQRIEAQLDGLMTAVEEAWEVCLDALELEQPGEVFTATVTAFRSHDVGKIQTAVEAGLKSDKTINAFISALGWLPEKQVHPWIKKFLTSKDLDHKYLALAACSVRRENPGEHLNRVLSRDDCKQHEKLYARALRLVGEFRRQDLSQTLIEAMGSDIDSIKFWSSWSSILLGNRKAAENLQVFIFKRGPYQLPAINIVFRVLPVEQARDLISKLAEDKTQMRAVVQATGILGDPHAVNWLISIMSDTALARIAAEAVSLITGIDLEQYQLTDELAPSVAQQPNDDAADEDVSLDEDENLPWPDVKKISQIWMNLGMNFIAGNRYFLGRNITPELLNDKIVSAYQRQRHAAAMELALSNTAMPLQNTRARVQA